LIPFINNYRHWPMHDRNMLFAKCASHVDTLFCSVPGDT
jgi:hypothetical protein